MFFDFFKKNKKTSAVQAKERLRIILAHERAENKAPFLDDLRKDLIDVIAKYIDIDAQSININLQKDQSVEVLEINIPIK
jgi:cell division topological specificity factor